MKRKKMKALDESFGRRRRREVSCSLPRKIIQMMV
jgi:hypothetical protein